MRALVIANWKMNPPTFREARGLFEATRKAAERSRGVTLVVAPPVIFLRPLSALYKGKRIAFALQGGHWEKAGAQTGEISMAQAQDARASYIIVGHSESRARGETNEDTRKKVAAALALKLTPILCVGERQRDQGGAHFTIVSEQLRAVFGELTATQAARVIVAYEPIWAIGGEESMSPRDMHEMAIFIRKSIVDLLGQGSMSVKIIYGGAATEENATAMLAGGDVVGLLVGHVSVDSKRFAALLSAISKSVV
ncbi:MAG TPA: triose-phosphate isomerase family protein [Candidatus Paceibacterota bacterium]